MKKQLDDLTLLADKYKCDKGSIKHNYTKIYNKYFSSFKNEKFKLLEIGFGKGASIKMWLDYFPNNDLYSVDIRKFPEEFLSINRLKCFIANQVCEKQMYKVYNNTKFKIIIDDGSHVSEDEIYSLGYLFSHLSSGGFYIVEDLNCKRSHNKKFKVEERKFIDIIKEFKNTNILKSEILNKDQIEYITKNIDKVEIYKDKIAFIQKM